MGNVGPSNGDSQSENLTTSRANSATPSSQLGYSDDSQTGDGVKVNLYYSDSNTGTNLDFNPIRDSSFYDGYKPSVELSNFFSRPLTIANIPWTISAPLDIVLQPWFLYFNDDRVKAKLQNFAYLSCNMKIKIMVNASPFYYALGIAAYQPKKNFNGCRIYSATTNRLAKYVSISQRPHVYLYPQCCQGGQMTLPYINQRNWLRVKYDDDFKNMGELSLNEIVQLSNANDLSGTNVNITILAWAEDVRLCGLTSALTLQADEYEGPISGPASAVARAAKSLSSIPIIGRYATATSIGANAVATIARLFGFTNVPNLESQHPMRNDPFFNVSSCDLSAPVDKLTIDPKNELTIDPRVIGLDPKDELVISSIACRESFLTSFMWSQEDVHDDIVFNLRVSPSLFNTSVESGQTQYYLTPMHMIAEMFQYWRGDIIVRFRVIASRFHKGRLRISWDPAAQIHSNPDTTNIVFTEIVDISQKQDFEIRIPYQQATAYARTDTSPVTGFNDGSSYVSITDSITNGNLTVRVYNQLTGLLETGVIHVAVSVRGAENLEFACPRDISREWTPFVPQSEELSYPDHCANTTVIKAPSSDQHTHLVYMGEVVKSLRPLLRRTCYVYTACTADTADASKFSVQKFMLPRKLPSYGYDTSGMSTTTSAFAPTGSYNVNFVHNIPLTWVGSCFVGSRGSLLYRINANRTIQSSNVTISRNKVPHTSISPVVTLSTSGDTANQRRYLQWKALDSGAAGIVLQNTVTQNGINFLLPMYSYFRMVTTDPYRVFSSGADSDDTSDDSMTIEITSSPASQDYNVDKYTNIEIYAAAGTDYSLFFFLNVPTLWRVILPKPSV
jgi:hypothetical protein